MPDVIRREFGLPDFLEPVNILAAGYSNEKDADPQRQFTQPDEPFMTQALEILLILPIN